MADTVTTASASPDPVYVAGTLTYRVSIGNQGPDAARNVQVSASVPGGVTVASTSPGCSVAGGTWQCTLLRVDADATADLQLAVRPQVTGTLAFSVSAVGNAPDPYVGNNTASVTNLVEPSPLPVANAGPDQSVRHNTKLPVTLDGVASYDPDGSIVSYRWQQVSGYPVTLSNASSIAAMFSVPKFLSPVPNELVFRLTVTDNAGGAASDTLKVTVTR